MLRYLVILLIAGIAITAVLESGAKMDKTKSTGDTVQIFNSETGKVETVKKVVKTDAQWKALLTPEQYRVTRLQGTEAPGTGTCSLPPTGESGVYQCVCCGTDLFKFDNKFESGTGWPSFWNPISPLNVHMESDDSYGTHRIEVTCARCGAHLGHVFDDGPPPTGKRYCMNAAALKLFVAKP